MDEYYALLTKAILVDQKPVTYRLLSHQLKTRVNTAKRVLYDFYTRSNATKPGSVHATYMITGVKGHSTVDAEGDIQMSLTPDEEHGLTQTRLLEQKPKRTVAVVSEERLDAAKGEFDTITGVHIYSLQPGPKLKDATMLTDCAYETMLLYRDEELDERKAYGSVMCEGVQKMERKIKFVPPADAPAKSGNMATADAPAKSGNLPTADGKKDEKKKEVKVEKKPLPAEKRVAKAPVPKKTASEAKKAFFGGWTENAAKMPAKPKEKEVSFGPESEDEDEEEPVDMPVEDTAEVVRQKKQREAELRAMMDEDEPVRSPSPPPLKRKSPSPEIEEVKPNEPLAPVNGNGKRVKRVKKTKQVQSRDEEGYLVTKLVDTWEEVTDDEPEPAPKQKQKPKMKAKAALPPTKKGGKKGAGQQANIMNFFQKKTA